MIDESVVLWIIYQEMCREGIGRRRLNAVPLLVPYDSPARKDSTHPNISGMVTAKIQ